MEKALACLFGCGVRPSLQRMAVMDYLLTHRTHPTAEEIYLHLSPSMATLSRTTVYNTLKLLVERGAVSAIDIEGRQTRYDGFTHLHGHFLCVGCGTLCDVPLDDALCRGIRSAIPAGVSAGDIQILYKGLCAACKAHVTENQNTN